MEGRDAASVMWGCRGADPINGPIHLIADAVSENPDERAAMISQWEVWCQDRMRMNAGPDQ